MAVVQNYLPGDSLLIDKIVYELKSQGIFDQFRKECISDVDTKPAYQNLRQRVEGSVTGFLSKQTWSHDMNKNQVREMLRKNIYESGFLETGVERIVDQVVNPKINSIFLPKVTEVVYKFLGIQKPNNGQSEHEQFKTNFSCENLLPTDLEAVSPESESMDKRLDVSNDSQNLEDNKLDDDESPPFEPIEEQTTYLPPEENSVDSHMSGFSGLVSHDSNHSIDLSKQIQVEVSNQDSMLSKHSSDGHLSIVISDDNETKMENCDDSHQSKSSKTNDSNSKHFEVSQDNSNKSSSKQDKKSDHKSDDKSKTEKSKSHDKHKSRHDSKSDSKDRKDDKDRKSDRDRKDHKDKHVSKDRDKSKDNKDRKDSKSYSKSEKDKERGDKDKNKSSSSSRHRSSSSSREKSNLKKESISKDKDRSENSNKEKLKSSTRDHKDSRSKDDKSKGDSKIHSKYESKSDRYKKDEKHHSKSEKHSSSSKSKEKDKKDSKKHKKENKDDHFSSKKRFDRRSTDRDSNDGQSGLKSSSSSFDSYLSSQTQNKNQESSNSNSGSGESGNSDSIEEEIVSLKAPIMFENKDIESIGELLINTEVQTLKLIKPKFASNIHEARRLMKIRKHLHKLEKEDVRNLANVLHNREKHVIEKVIKTNESVAITPDNVNNDHIPNILKKQSKFVKTNSLLSTPIKIDITELKCKPKEKSPEPVSPPLKTAVVSAATWDALEAKLNQSIDYSTCYDVPDTPEKNEMQVTSTTPSTSKKDEPQIPLPNPNDCLYLECTSPKTERYIKFVKTLIMKLEKDVESSNKRFKTIDHDSKTNLSTAKLQQFAQKKSLKRKITDIHSDVRNNNKKFNHHIEVHENFSLPLSPAESDKSIDKKSDSSESSDKSARKAGTESTEKTKRTLIRASTKTQRYSSEDLYKPRPLFSGSRRRTGRNLAID